MSAKAKTTSDTMEIGGNVFELIEFTLDRSLANGEMTIGRYGVNVAKVREVVRMPTINPLASSVAGIAGVFELRGIPIPAINLAAALGDPHIPLRDDQQIIVTEFSSKRAGFIVKATQRIRRVAWDRVLPPASDRRAGINGMTLVENNEFLFILDLEKILLDIEHQSGFLPQVSEFSIAEKNRSEVFHKKGINILLVEDSEIILHNATFILEREGYTIFAVRNGLEAKDYMQALEQKKPGFTKIDLVISDVEMPKMDGLSLTKWIKQRPMLKHIPVIMHTSLAGEANQEAAKTVGADQYVVKNDFTGLIRAVGSVSDALKAS